MELPEKKIIRVITRIRQNPPECVTPFRVTRKPIPVRIRDLESPKHSPKSAAPEPIVLGEANRRKRNSGNVFLLPDRPIMLWLVTGTTKPGHGQPEIQAAPGGTGDHQGQIIGSWNRDSDQGYRNA